MNILNDTVLDEFCLTTVQNAASNPLLQAYLLFLYNTGCRPSEPLTPSCFVARDADNLILQPAKKNNLRFIPLSDVPPSIFSVDNNNESYMSMRNYTATLKHFAKLKPITFTSTDNKNTQLYLFRYNYVKQLYFDGLSHAQITSHMGWKNDSIVYRYLQTSIYTL